MTSKTHFREHGTVIHTQGRWSQAGQHAWVALAVLAVLGVLALGAWLDEPADVPVLAEAQFEAGRMAEREAAMQRVAWAYRQGYNDALAELAQPPSAARRAARAGAQP